MSKRILDNVVKLIIAEIPESFDDKNDLISGLNDRVDSYHYTAPELMWLRWQEVGELLGTYLGEPDTEWKEKIVNIFADKE